MNNVFNNDLKLFFFIYSTRWNLIFCIEEPLVTEYKTEREVLCRSRVWGSPLPMAELTRVIQ